MSYSQILMAITAPLLFVAGIACLLLRWRYSHKPNVAASTRQRLPTAEEVELAVSEAASCRNAIVFAYVAWAPMERQHERFVEFKRLYETRYPNGDLSFHDVDCTAIAETYGPLRALPGWNQLETVTGGSLIHGKGEFVWLNAGRVLHVQSPLELESTEALIAKTAAIGMIGTAEQLR